MTSSRTNGLSFIDTPSSTNLEEVACIADWLFKVFAQPCVELAVLLLQGE
jgi:hypothetical protein